MFLDDTTNQGDNLTIALAITKTISVYVEARWGIRKMDVDNVGVVEIATTVLCT